MAEDFDIDAFVSDFDSTVLAQVAQTLAINSDKHEMAANKLRQGIRASLETYSRELWLKETFNASADRRALKRIANAAQKLVDEIDDCSEGALHLLDRAWPKDAATPADFQSALDTLAVVAAPKPGKVGRPRTRGPLSVLVCWLTTTAEEYGGIASTKANDQSGRLVDALNILRDLLPFKIVPAALPFGSIEKWQTDHRRIQHQLAIKNGTKVTRL